MTGYVEPEFSLRGIYAGLFDDAGAMARLRGAAFRFTSPRGFRISVLRESVPLGRSAFSVMIGTPPLLQTGARCNAQTGIDFGMKRVVKKGCREACSIVGRSSIRSVSTFGGI